MVNAKKERKRANHFPEHTTTVTYLEIPERRYLQFLGGADLREKKRATGKLLFHVLARVLSLSLSGLPPHPEQVEGSQCVNTGDKHRDLFLPFCFYSTGDRGLSQYKRNSGVPALIFSCGYMNQKYCPFCNHMCI